MALTEQDKQELLNAIKAESQSVEELETVTSLDGVVSLPAMKGSKMVNAPISLLSQPAKDAASQALAAKTRAEEAAATAESAAEEAGQAILDTQRATSDANAAAAQAREASDEAAAVVATHAATAARALQGTTLRFDEILEETPSVGGSTAEAATRIAYNRTTNRSWAI